MLAAGQHVPVFPLRQREARVGPEASGQRERVAELAREETRRDRDQPTRSSAEREREHLFLPATVGMQRPIFATVEEARLRLAHRQALADDVQLRAPVAEIREQLRGLRHALFQLHQ